MLTVNDDSPKHKKVIEYKVTETRQKHKLFAARHFIHMYVRMYVCNMFNVKALSDKLAIKIGKRRIKLKINCCYATNEICLPKLVIISLFRKVISIFVF